METGQILQIKSKSGRNNYWYIENICLGALKQESVVHISRADGFLKPTCLGKARAVLVPIIMIERLIETGEIKVFDKFPEYEHELTHQFE